MPRRRRRRHRRRHNSAFEPQNLEMEHTINRSRSVTAARGGKVEHYRMSGREIVFIQRPLKVFYNTRRRGRHAPAHQTHSRFRVRYVARGRYDTQRAGVSDQNQRAKIVKYLFGPVAHHLIPHLSRTLQPRSENCGVQRVHERFLSIRFVDFEFQYLAFGMFHPQITNLNNFF